MSDRLFHEKRDLEFGFAQSPLQLNAGLKQLKYWNAETIEKRAQDLADIATQIWSIPALSAEQLGKYGKWAHGASLVEVIGPVEHPLAGFVPSGYKIVSLGEKKFQYYRQLEGEWVPYGNGKIAWYAISWGTVGRWLRYYDKNDTKPLGIGGEIAPRYAKTTNGDASGHYQNSDDANDKNVYSLDSYPHLQGTMSTLFERLRKRILNLDPLVREECKKFYIAYKTTTNFVDIVVQKNQLLLSLNMQFSEISDPRNLCRDVTMLGHHGNGDIEVSVSSLDQLDDVMDLIRQAFEEHREEGDV